MNRHVLIDICDFDLDPSIAHSAISGDGRLARAENKEQFKTVEPLSPQEIVKNIEDVLKSVQDIIVKEPLQQSDESLKQSDAVAVTKRRSVDKKKREQ